MYRMLEYILLSAVLITGEAGAVPVETRTPAPQETESYVLKSVEVTVRKTEEDIQKVPVSASVFSGEMLEGTGFDNTSKLTRFAPNVYLTMSGYENVITMRGGSSFESFMYPPTAVYIDDLIMPLHFSHWIDLIDIERVEVLRGPQGRLYGGNSLTGGFNYGTAIDNSTFTYDPEYTWNYEVGIKTEWLNHRLQANLALFYIAMSDKQVREMQYGEGGFTAKIDNAAKTHSKGFELELKARPASGWDISTGLGYTDAVIDDWIATEWNSDFTALIQNDYRGKKVPGVPEFTDYLGIQYRHPGGFFICGDLCCLGSVYADHKNNIKDDAHVLVNFRLGYSWKNLETELYGRNIFNTEYHAVSYDWDGAKLVQDGEPAMFGIRLTLRS